MSDLLALAWRRYLRSLRTRPLPTKAVTAGVLAGCSDLIAQRLSGASRLKFRRTLLMAVFGLVYGGPSAHFMHKLQELIFGARNDGFTVIKKVLLDQLTYGPVCNVVTMLYVGLAIERRSWDLVRKKVRSDYPSVQINGWKLWPLAGLINYKFMPVQLRVLFLNIVAIFWSTFLILRSRSSPLKKLK